MPKLLSQHPIVPLGRTFGVRCSLFLGWPREMSQAAVLMILCIPYNWLLTCTALFWTSIKQLAKGAPQLCHTCHSAICAGTAVLLAPLLLLLGLAQGAVTLLLLLCNSPLSLQNSIDAQPCPCLALSRPFLLSPLLLCLLRHLWVT